MLLFLTISLGCSKKKNNDISGVYKSKEISKVKVAYSQLIHRKLYVKNNQLTIGEDSTFEYITCGNCITGKYAIQKDTLKLFCYSNTQKWDSLVRTFQSPYDTLNYYIKNDGALIRYTKIDDNGKFNGYSQQDYLIKTIKN